MKTLIRLILPVALGPVLALAVYAPIPEQEQGKALTYRLSASAYHDSNIFGAPPLTASSPVGTPGEIDSMVYNLTAAISYSGSVDDQTFASASYEVSNDHVVDRPGSTNLTSHSLSARVAHAFSPATNIDVTGNYAINRNPQSLLAGRTLNTDQSHKRGQIDARFVTTGSEKTGVVVKARRINYRYDDGSLAGDLDRVEVLGGVELTYALLPETKLVAEYRYQTIGYSYFSATKDKESHFLMAGVDYNPGKQLLLSGRVGAEDRSRSSAPDTTVPYVELSSRYTYAEGSYLAAGYTYTLEESSDVTNYTDSKVNRLFVNVQHRLTGALTASGSLTYEPSQLQGRGTHSDDDEKTTRAGVGLSWQPNKNWTVTGTIDVDEINSDAANRDQSRERFGVSARFTF